MINWNYDPNVQNYDEVKPGLYRVRIDDAKEALSQSGREMIKMKLKISGLNANVWYNMVFLEEYKDTTNRRLREIYNSFGITPGDINPEHWKGKVGAAEIVEETTDGKKRTVVKKFLDREQQINLPAWQENGTVYSAPIYEQPFNPNMVNPNGNIPF